MGPSDSQVQFKWQKLSNWRKALESFVETSKATRKYLERLLKYKESFAGDKKLT